MLSFCCRLCYNAPETLSHLLLNFRLVQSLWRAISSAFCHRIRLDRTIVDLWMDALEARFSLPIFLFMEVRYYVNMLDYLEDSK